MEWKDPKVAMKEPPKAGISTRIYYADKYPIKDSSIYQRSCCSPWLITLSYPMIGICYKFLSADS